MALVKTGATYDDLRAVPDRLIAEIIDGNLHVSPHPSVRHCLAQSVLIGVVGSFSNPVGAALGGWWILFQPEVHLGDDVLVPDVVGWRRERLPAMPDAPWMTLPPDWVCEVLTPDTEQMDRVDKLRIYRQAGVGHAWLVKPEIGTLEVYRRADGGWTLVGTHGDEGLVRLEPFDALEWELSRLWPETA
jgi:Uma2 family endonuclease